MRKVLVASTVFVLACGIATAETFFANITKVEEGSITAVKRVKGKKKGETVTLKLADKVTVNRATLNRKEKKIEVVGELKGGLQSKVFGRLSSGKAKRGIRARITTNDQGQVTQIDVLTGGKKKKKKDA